MRIVSKIVLLIKASLLVVALSACGGGGNNSGNTAEPVPLDDNGIAYVKRVVPRDSNGNLVQADARRAYTFNAGGDLYYRAHSSPSATEKNLTGAITGGKGDVRDVEVSYDGTKLIFALRLPELPNTAAENQPTWNIWEYNLTTSQLHRVITSDTTAEEGQDVSPHYLPETTTQSDGTTANRIIFASTRQRSAKAILLDEGKAQFAALEENRREHALALHIMDADGGRIKQVTFNQSHDMDPTVLANGEVVFSRWDNMGSNSAIDLYKMRPDGTELSLLYGGHSHATGTNNSIIQFLSPRQMADGKLLSLARSFTGTFSGGDIIAIDTDTYVDNTAGVAAYSNLTGPAQTSLSGGQIRTDSTPTLAGRLSSFYPLDDGSNRALVTWSPCRLLENNVVVACTATRLAAATVTEAEPFYGVYVQDLDGGNRQPVVLPESGQYISEVVAVNKRTTPPVLFDKTTTEPNKFDSTLVADNLGIMDIRSVYDFDGRFSNLGTSASGINGVADFADPSKATADQRPARFLGIVKAVSMPDRNTKTFRGTAFGRSSGQLMREIIGYVPIEPDGSVKFKAPANVAFTIEVLDKNARRIGGRHQNWLQLRPGEIVTCNGCHTHSGNNKSHGRPDVSNSINSGFTGVTGDSFPKTDTALWAESGETMAETHARHSCITDNCASMTPSVDVVYDDVWTDATAAGRAKDSSFADKYSDIVTSFTTAGATFTPPVSSACQTTWTAKCRTVINYVTQIQPIWNLTRGNGTDGDGLPDTCISCHTTNGNTQIPAGNTQLDLTDSVSDQNADHLTSYRELFFTDKKQVLNGGVLQDELVDSGNVDALGNPIYVNVSIGPVMSTAGANSNSTFFNLFASGGSHAGRLSAAELRLISEWLDIGAQYYNNPFDAP